MGIALVASDTYIILVVNNPSADEVLNAQEYYRSHVYLSVQNICASIIGSDRRKSEYIIIVGVKGTYYR